LSELWKNNIRAEADLSNDFSQPDLNQNVRARFLVTFKQKNYNLKRMVKIKDYEMNKQEEDVNRENLIEYIKERVKNII
jgi:Anticodon binding domain of tRNAs